MQAHPAWDVINQGVDGERSDQILARFDRDVLAQRPNVVVLIAGVNDVYQGRPAAEAGIAVVAGSIVPYNTATAEQNARMREVNDWIRDTAAADPHIEFVDTRAAVAAPDDPDRLFESPDGLHPSPAGYRRMADVIRPAVERHLTKNSDRP